MNTVCKWIQKDNGMWSTSCGRKIAWFMDKCPACKKKTEKEQKHD